MLIEEGRSVTIFATIDFDFCEEGFRMRFIYIDEEECCCVGCNFDSLMMRDYIVSVIFEKKI